METALNKKKVNIGLSSSQLEFFKSDEQYTLFAGGLGSGKTYAGAVWAIYMALQNPHVRGLITANSYKQLNRATLVKVFEICDLMQLKYTYKKQAGELIIEGALIDVVSMENYDDLRGPEYGWAWSDECAFYKKEAFDVLIGRLRDKRCTCQWKGTTTPNGYNWLYTVFVEDPLPGSIMVKARTLDNIGNLTQNYYKVLIRQYDSRLAIQELEGGFINLNVGKVYHAFDRELHVKKVSHEHAIVYVGLDFNVHPMCGVYCVQRDGVIQVVDELYQEDSNTFKAAKEILTKYPWYDIRVIPDSTGNTRVTSAKQKDTDHQILRDANLKVEKVRNPVVRDRQNNVNRLLEQNKLVISPNCKKLIADLEKLGHDNKDDMLEHISTALGYACWHLQPMKKPKRKATVRYS